MISAFEVHSIKGMYIEKDWRCHNRINAILTCWCNVCDVDVLRILPGDAVYMSSAISRV